MNEAIIDVQRLSKHYPPNVKAVDDITFHIDSRHIFSMLGPNGAGKTTTVEILEGLRNPTSGSATIFGADVTREYSKLRSKVGILPQNFEPFDNLKPTEAVQYWAGLYDIKISSTQVNGLLERVGLNERRSILSRKLSGGEKRKLGIALSLINEPEVLFLDEPTTGLDPKARRDLWHLIEEIKSKGTTVFLTTHYLDEAEKLADDVAIMNRGKIVARGSPQDLISKHGKMTMIVITGAGADAVRELNRRGIEATQENGDVLVPVNDPMEMRAIFQKISGIELKIKDMYTRRQSLEDVFLNLVGAKMDDGVLRE
jgi:ABC-2 type transport system ATP-binding protein